MFGKRFKRRIPTARTYRYPKFVPSTHAARIRLIPGKYTSPAGIDKMKFLVTHYSAVSKKTSICSSEWKLVGDEFVRDENSSCVGCYLNEAAAGGKSSVSMSVKYAVTVLVLENFHLSKLGYDGEPLGKDDDGKQKYRKAMCTGAGCEGCKRGEETVFGRKLVWEIPPTYGDVLTTTLAAYSKTCGNCGHEGLEIVSALCPHCGREYPYDIDEIPDDELLCPTCNKMGEPVLEFDCENCDDPSPPDLFNATFLISATKDGKWKKLAIPRTWIGPMSKSDKKKLKEAHGENYSRLFEPLDLDNIYRPNPLSVQATVLGVQNPYLADETVSYDDDSGGPKKPF